MRLTRAKLDVSDVGLRTAKRLRSTVAFAGFGAKSSGAPVSEPLRFEGCGMKASQAWRRKIQFPGLLESQVGKSRSNNGVDPVRQTSSPRISICSPIDHVTGVRRGQE